MHKSMLAVAFLVLPLLVQDPQESSSSTQPRVGDALPHFRLNDQDGHALSIGGTADHWTVIAFYPKAATPG